MSSGPKTAGLPNICSLVTDGTHDSPTLQPSGIPFIKGKHISSGRIDFENCDFIAEEEHAKCVKRVKPQVDDVLFANIGSVGDVARVTDDCEFSIKNVALFRPDPSKVDPTYFYYLVVSPSFRGVFLSVRSGAAQPFISLEAFRSHRFPFNPDKAQQRKIGIILSTYDELIENNRRRMALLEAAARRLYREWFVRLRFPGHEHTRITNGVPEGWEKATAFSAMEVLSGGTPKTNVADYWDGEIPFYTPKDATDACYVLQTERSITELGLKNCNSRLYAPDTVFISARGTVGKLNLASGPMAMSQSCYALVGKRRISKLFLFCALKETIEHFKQHAVGAVFDAIIVDTFKLIPFTVPDDKKVRLFEQTVTPMFRQVANLMEQIGKLRTARDLLLPRMMNGEISV